jgi:hypothetical protein
MFPEKFMGSPEYSLFRWHGRTHEVQYFKYCDKEVGVPKIGKQKTWAKTYARENNYTTFLTTKIEEYSNLVGLSVQSPHSPGPPSLLCCLSVERWALMP